MTVGKIGTVFSFPNRQNQKIAILVKVHSEQNALKLKLIHQRLKTECLSLLVLSTCWLYHCKIL